MSGSKGQVERAAEEPRGEYFLGRDKRADDAPPPLEIAFRGTAADITPLVLETVLFNISTLTLYRFWSRTRVRRALWSRVEIDGDPLEYTGRGREMLIGFTIVLFFVLIPLALGAAALQFIDPFLPVLLYPVPAFLLGVAIYRARAYRLSRTLWRSVRFGQTGSSVGYSVRLLGYAVLSTISFGLLSPLKRNALFRYEMQRTWFGDRTFTYRGGAGALFGPFLGAYLLRILLFCITMPVAAIVFGVLAAVFGEFGGLLEAIENTGAMALSPLAAIGIGAFAYLVFGVALVAANAPMAWYYARQYRHFAEHTRLGELGFEMQATGASLAALAVGNALIMLLTLGLGRPFAQMRTIRYIASRLKTRGEADLAGIGPSPVTRSGVGEGLADAFDVGAV